MAVTNITNRGMFELLGLQGGGGGGGGGSDILSLLGPLSGASSGVSFNLLLIHIQLKKFIGVQHFRKVTFKKIFTNSTGWWRGWI